MDGKWTDQELRRELGQHFMVGLPGTELTPEFEKFLAEYQAGNIILFARNVESCGQLRRLCRQLQECIRANTGHSALISIDQEGGPVIRLAEDGVNIPAAMALAAAGGEKEVLEAGRMTGRQLRAVGVNFDFAPDMDINCNPDNPVIGVRSYGDTPQQVSACGSAMIRGLQENGVLGCAKHFPGHGDTNMDSHLSLPCVDKTAEELERMEILPFVRAVKEDVAGIMTAHILFPALEPEKVPATMSRRILTGLLRQKLGYEGLIVTDSMEMAAIKTYYGTGEGSAAALAAGADIVLVCHEIEDMVEAMEKAAEAVRTGRIDAGELRRSTERILRMKEKYRLEEETPLYDNSADRAAAEEMEARALTPVRWKEGRIPDLGADPLFAGCARYRATLANNQADSRNSFAVWMAEHYGGDSCTIPPDPSDEEIETVLAEAEKHSGLVLGSFNGHLKPGQRRLLGRLGEVKVPVLVVTLGIPYDLCDVPGQVAGLAAWEYTEKSLKAVLAVLKGERKPEGNLPVRLG